MHKKRNKLKPEEEAKIEARFKAKYKEFMLVSLYDDLNSDGTAKVPGLRTLYRETKMSGTDKRALVLAVDHLLLKENEERLKEAEALKAKEQDGDKES